MIVPDVNVLIYAHNSDVRQYRDARTWLQSALAGSEPVGIPWAVIHGFLRLVTAPTPLATPLDTEHATTIVESWLSWPAVSAIEPRDRYWAIFKDLLRATGTSGRHISDLHIAALAIENDATVATTDRDFARFPNVRVLNPLL